MYSAIFSGLNMRKRGLADEKVPYFCIHSLDGDDGIVGNVLEGIMRLKQPTT
jgi:hypothetical protein